MRFQPEISKFDITAAIVRTITKLRVCVVPVGASSGRSMFDNPPKPDMLGLRDFWWGNVGILRDFPGQVGWTEQNQRFSSKFR